MRFLARLTSGLSLLVLCTTVQAQYDYGLPAGASLPPVETVNAAPVQSLTAPVNVAPVEVSVPSTSYPAPVETGIPAQFAHGTSADVYGVSHVAPVVHSSNVSGYVGRIEALERHIDSLQTEVSQASYHMVGAEQHGKVCCDDWSGYGGGAFYAEFEALMVAVHRTDGLRVGTANGDTVTPGWDIAPRTTLGYIMDDGLTFRVRVFDYHHTQVSGLGGGIYSLNAWYMDFEVADTVQLNCDWSIELSGGFRWHDFEEQMNDTGGEFRMNDFIGGGITAGAVARRAISETRSLYGGFRGGVIYGRKQRDNVTSGPESHEDVVSGFFEISGGWEQKYCLNNGATLIVKSGGENQIWTDHTSTFDTGAAGEDTWLGTGDLGIAMQVLSFTYVQ